MWTDGWTDGQTDRQGDSYIPPKLCLGGIIMPQCCSVSTLDFARLKFDFIFNIQLTKYFVNEMTIPEGSPDGSVHFAFY